ncbi:MAG: DUF4282 domain-containing protein [Acidobacteriia bacterium]|nr:DUF4282 domain-containing protein [Terriglobia bacterium]
MAFCAKCGTQLTAGAAACSACGSPTGIAAPAATPPAPARYIPPVNAQEAAGFLSSLFDLSFTTFVTTKLIKVLFIISIVIAAFASLGLVVSMFATSAIAGIFMLLIGAPLLFFFYVIYARVVMEVLIVIFRCSEYLAEIAKQGRRS